jgi:molybdopterin synthase sulfur carrier subunit
MQINILAFGQIADIAGKNSWKLENVDDTDSMKQKLEQLYPVLKEMKYLIAVDKTIIQTNTPLSSDVTVALLPPFSGG